MDYIVCGIGINIYEPVDGFPEGIIKTAGYLFEDRKADMKNLLAAEFLKEFMKIYWGDDFDLIGEYKSKTNVLGREIEIIKKDGKERARALDIDDKFRLLVEFPDGRKEKLSNDQLSLVIGE